MGVEATRQLHRHEHAQSGRERLDHAVGAPLAAFLIDALRADPARPADRSAVDAPLTRERRAATSLRFD